MRKWIWKALDEVVNKDVYSNLYLRNHLHEVDEKDRALATRIFYGTIQNYRYCKACWSKYVKNKLNPKMDVVHINCCFWIKYQAMRLSMMRSISQKKSI